MTWKNFFIRLGGFIALSAIALPLYALTVNGLILSGAIPEDLVDQAFGNTLTMKAMFVWLGCLIVGFSAIFIKANWAKILYFCPLYAPSIFAVIYTLIQN